VKRLWILALAALAAATLALPSTAFGQVSFPDGVASGDVTQTRAILWTRVTGLTTPEQIKVEGWTNSSLSGPKAFKGKFKPTADRDWTVKIDVTELQPGTQYWYRFQKDADVSAVGTFETAPAANSAADVKFTYTGDSDVQKVNGVNPFNNWETLSAAQSEGGDFFVYNGDTIYSDSSYRPGGPAITLSDYRADYRLQRTYSNLTNLLASTSTYPLMDDHEVYNDYDGQTVDPARYAAGRQAFLENMPIRETGLPHDPSCAGDPLYRTVKWGSETELFILDERSCRSGSVEVNPCGGDLGPTLPLAIRQSFPYTLFFGLPGDAVPAGCLAAINDPNRTSLGPVQKARFKTDLLNSTATHKIVISELAIQQFHALPYDRWEGYAAERTELLDYIQNNGIENVEFLTTDNHATIQNQVFKDRFENCTGVTPASALLACAAANPPTTIANEAITGPIATNTLQNEVLGFAGAIGLFAFNSILNVDAIDCRHLDKYSYGLVNVNAAADTATVSSRDSNGAVIADQNVSTTNCQQVYGP
jgi:phosphodiesterase/alkaline phosphatase D-like protein